MPATPKSVKLGSGYTSKSRSLASVSVPSITEPNTRRSLAPCAATMRRIASRWRNSAADGLRRSRPLFCAAAADTKVRRSVGKHWRYATCMSVVVPAAAMGVSELQGRCIDKQSVASATMKYQQTPRVRAPDTIGTCHKPRRYSHKQKFISGQALISFATAAQSSSLFIVVGRELH